MASFQIMEGYGVRGPAASVKLTTTSLLSCSAVILFDHTHRILGLFHYPACCLSAPGIQGAMIQMINDIQPTDIVIWTAHPQEAFGSVALEKKIIQLDNAKLKTFLELKKPSACTVSLRTGEGFRGVSSNGVALDFQTQIAGKVQVPGSATISSGGGETRKQLGSLWFYYGSTAGTGDYGAKLENAASRILLGE